MPYHCRHGNCQQRAFCNKTHLSFSIFGRSNLKFPDAIFSKLQPGPVWRSTIASLLLLGLAGLGISELAGAATGLGVTALVLLLLLLVDRWHQHALHRWVIHKHPLPPTSGTWDELFARLYRQERASSHLYGELTEALAGFRRAAQALPDGVVTLNRDNQILWFNAHAADHLHLKLASDTGNNISNLLRAPEFLAYLASAAWDNPVLIRMRDMRPAPDRLLSLRLCAYGDGQKLLLTRDVTNIEKLETMRRDFVANVSHELKTPLTVLSGFLETIRELPLSPEQTGQYLTLMSEQSHRMENLVADLLTLSALEGSNHPDEQRVDVARLLTQIESTARHLSEGRHTIEFHVEAGLDLLGADSEISSALGNLVSNAVRYTPTGGTIVVRWEQQEQEEGVGARFSVTDNGIGIDPVHLPRLTERFYRIDRGRSRESGGTGLGLAIVKHALTRHLAVLDVQSTPGTGSCFAAIFPPRRVLLQSRSPV
jgi:two-component system phosphate regulon sensor histidine kinase PhoR